MLSLSNQRPELQLRSNDLLDFEDIVYRDVDKIFPQIVHTEDGSQYGIAYSGFGVLAIKAIQEQQEQIILLQEKIKEFEARLEE